MILPTKPPLPLSINKKDSLNDILIKVVPKIMYKKVKKNFELIFSSFLVVISLNPQLSILKITKTKINQIAWRKKSEMTLP